MIPAFIADRENRKRRGEFDNSMHVSAGVVTRVQLDDDDDDDDDVGILQSKGGGVPAAPSPMSEAQAQIELERARSDLAQQAAERQRQQDLADKNARIDKARPLQAQAYGAAQDYGTQQVGARGFDQGLVDKYGLMGLYDSALDRTRLGIQEDDLTPMASYNTSTMFNDALGTAQGTYRGDLKKQLNTIAPEDFSYGIFNNSADDSILASILGQGKSDAQAQIDQAKARGQLNDVGYSRALTQLGNQGQSGMADLQDIGQGVLGGYRKQLDDLRSGALDRVGGATFDDPYSFDTFNNRLNQLQTDLGGRMQGDIFRATQGQSFFDPASIISGSGAVQGFYNPTTTTTKQSPGVTNPLLDAFTNDPTKQQQQKTATGTNGVF